MKDWIKREKYVLGTGAKARLVRVTFIRETTDNLDDTLTLIILSKGVEDAMKIRKNFKITLLYFISFIKYLVKYKNNKYKEEI